MANFFQIDRKSSSLNSSQHFFSLFGVDVFYGSTHALKGIELSVEESRFLFLTGESGAGKTTLLKLLSGQIKADRGKIVRPRFADEDSFICHLRQDYRPIEKMTAEDHLWGSYDPEFYRSENSFYNEMLELSKFLDFGDRLGQKTKDLNGGAKQKLAVIQAILSRPRALLLDEPTSSLDKASSFAVYELLAHMNQTRGLTILWASHNRDLVKQFSGTMIHLVQGKIAYKGQACFI